MGGDATDLTHTITERRMSVKILTYYNMKDSKKQHRVREDYHMKRQYYEQLGDEVHFQNKPSVATENRR